jgi:hypothetical protein
MNDETVVELRAAAEQLLDLSQAMLAAAKSDDWEAFELREHQRSVLLDGICGRQPPDEATKLFLAPVIEQIQQLDRASTDLIVQQRDVAASELRRLKNTRQGHNAYQTVADNSSL